MLPPHTPATTPMATVNHITTGISPEPLSASGRESEKLSLPSLQSKMKIDPEGYETELGLLYSQFNSAIDLFQQQAALNFSSVSTDHTIAKDLGDRAMFLAHVTPFYPKQLANFPIQLAEFLKSAAKSLPSGLRCNITQALILLVNRKAVELSKTLALFMELQSLGDRNLRKLVFNHVVHSIRRMNKKHKNEVKNRALQNVLFSLLQQEDETTAKRALITLCELHRRKVWFDDRTANAICTACFHSSSRIMIAAMSFLLDFEKIEDEDDSDASSSEDETNKKIPQVTLNKAAIYKANHTGTVSSKKKKKAKLERAMRSMKKQQRLTSEKSCSNNYSPLNHLKDAQGFVEKLFSRLQTCNERFERTFIDFVEKLFSRLQTCNERFEIKMMMLKLIARVVGLHRLMLLNFYPFLQKYIQPHQRDITNLLAAAVQACHDMVPPDAVEPLFRQIVNQFVHDRSRPEVIAVGLNVIREICVRIPLLMTEDLLQDLVLYKKSHEKAVSVAARSLMTLFREVCPSLLIKKDRGRPVDPKARPKAYGEVDVASDVPGFELLQQDDDDNEEDIDDLASIGFDGDQDSDEMLSGSEDEMYSDSRDDSGDDGDNITVDDSDGSISDGDDDEEEKEDDVDVEEEGDGEEEEQEVSKSKSNKRKLSDFDGQLIAADTSLRALKKLAEEKMMHTSLESVDGILSNEDFQRIKELKAKNEAKIALSRHGIKVPSSDQLRSKRVDPAMLEAHVRKKMSKDERLALVKAGREDRGKYQSRTAMKQNKTGGLTNRQKEHKKPMPIAAKRAKVAKNRQLKNKKKDRNGKQFRGKKAWKQ